jgi:hypothetical protein
LLVGLTKLYGQESVARIEPIRLSFLKCLAKDSFKFVECFSSELQIIVHGINYFRALVGETLPKFAAKLQSWWERVREFVWRYF